MSLPPSIAEQSLPNSSFKRKMARFTLRAVFASVVTIFLSQVNLDYLEAFLYDLRIRSAPTSESSGLVEIIFFDKKSVESLKSDLSPRILGKIVEKASEGNPKYLLLAISPDELSGPPQEKKQLAEILEKIPNLVVTTDKLTLKGDEVGLSLAPPFENIRVASAPRTVDQKIYAKDGVTRRMLISYQSRHLLHAEIASSYRPLPSDIKELPGTFDFAGSDQAYIRFHPAGTYPRLSAIDLLTGSPPDYENKTVIIGNLTEKNSQDYILTPYSREVLAMSIAEMHANMLDTLILRSAPKLVPSWVNFLLTWLVSLLTVHVVLTLRPAKGLGVLAGTVFGFSLISYLSFCFAGLWLPMAAPLLTIFLCYYFFIPYRLIVENRRSWEYYQKNKILSQVEELKTNFISMMSHDLKTPIARIQGMTDMILSDAVSLSSQQREGVDTIRQSADDLLKFINAILHYGRIESEGVQLHLQSKDVNSILQEVIRKHEFLAKVKRIQIVCELEPLFPVPIDPDLMRQVFSNLVENAIKYSPEDTKIMVSSEETPQNIIVQVADQGPGIPADELQNIFMKFFRSKNAKSSPIKGSGLGLYLAKYFTELHKGQIFVESTHGNGSTFTVQLPIEQGGPHA